MIDWEGMERIYREASARQGKKPFPVPFHTADNSWWLDGTTTRRFASLEHVVGAIAKVDASRVPSQSAPRYVASNLRSRTVVKRTANFVEYWRYEQVAGELLLMGVERVAW